jgi:inorganic pyrophosphatase
MTPDRLPTRPQSGAFHVVIESPARSAVKIKFDPALGAFRYSRPLVAGLTYPFDWGFVPGTQAPDGDPLDAMVLSDAPTATGVVIACRALGVLRLTQREPHREARQRNVRVIAVPVVAPRWNDGPLKRSRSRYKVRAVGFSGVRSAAVLAVVLVLPRTSNAQSVPSGPPRGALAPPPEDLVQRVDLAAARRSRFSSSRRSMRASCARLRS